MSGPKSFAAPWPTKPGGTWASAPADDLEALVECTEELERLPSVQAERREVENLLDQRARLRAEPANIDKRLDELGVELNQ